MIIINLGADFVLIYFSTLFGTMIIMPFVAIFIRKIQRNRGGKREKKKLFFETLQEGLNNGSINTFNETTRIFKGVFDVSGESAIYHYGLNKSLYEFLVKLHSRDKTIIDESLDNNTINNWIEKIDKFIEEAEKVSPYAELPSAERNTLNDISNFLDNKDTEAVRRKISELGSMIETRDDELNRQRGISRWAIFFAILGLAANTALLVSQLLA